MPAIRPGEPRDLPAIAAIQASSPEAANWNPADYLNYDLHVFTVDGRVAGFLVARALDEDQREILNLAVAPEYRRRGVAKGLLSHFLEGVRGIVFLEVRASNEAAREFYNCMGFQEFARRPHYYEAPPEPAIVMKFHSC